jgi:hypothetical protein
MIGALPASPGEPDRSVNIGISAFKMIGGVM